MIVPISKLKWVEDDSEKAAAYLNRVGELRAELVELHGKLRGVCMAHGRTMANRWQKRQKEKRKSFLKTAFPAILEVPFDLPPGRIELNRGPNESFMNVEDLSTGSNLMSLLATRTLYRLSDWVPYDKNTKSFEGFHCPWLVLLSGDNDSYACLISLDEQAKRQHKGMLGGVVGVSLGVIVLDFQIKVIKFLYNIVQLLLSDIDLSKPPKDNLPLTMADIIDLSSRSPIERYRLRAYSHPIQFSKEKLINLVLSKLLDVQDNWILLRTDPVYFHTRLQTRALYPLRGMNGKLEQSDWHAIMEQLVIAEYESLKLWSLAWSHVQTLFGLVHKSEEKNNNDCHERDLTANDSRKPTTPPLAEADHEDARSMAEESDCPETRGKLMLSTTEETLARLHVILDFIVERRESLHGMIINAPTLKHLFQRTKQSGFVPSKVTFLRTVSRREAGQNALVDLIDPLWTLGDETSFVKVIQLPRLYAVVDEIIQKDIHQRGRLPAVIHDIVSELQACDNALLEISIHPDRRYFLSEAQRIGQRDKLRGDVGCVQGWSTTTAVPTMFQERYLFDGNVPSQVQENKARRALQLLWQHFDPGCHELGESSNGSYGDTRHVEDISPAHSHDISCVGQPLITVGVKKKNFRVLQILFGPLSEMEDSDVTWEGFLQALRAIGFRADRIFGTQWRVIPSNESPWPAYPISLQEPLPGPRLTWQQARFITKRMFRHYNLQQSSFIMSE
ncbi:hypothetical protein DACRYDRAFT_21681 [Dacryopinax primogenitus]|uniref:Uncharacterized protein n=1 Tax=Dacryopinax primogenitus (strain DJM 731) TaxID=1858805 RepID=M5G1R5_DACPD|nr:uncharacterized protein DACRYDRAFT_21681 [Dacryopinax primogenitus]EJU02649.1 hypothetical protein DACRYDRAFT_21681 [Dacryopinax primogenitus]